MTSTVTLPTWLFVVLVVLAQRHGALERVGARIMEAISRIVPVLPVSLIAAVFVPNRDSGWSELELKSAAYDLILRMEQADAYLYVPRGDLDYAIGVGLRMLLLRRVVVEQDRLYRAGPGEGALPAYLCQCDRAAGRRSRRATDRSACSTRGMSATLANDGPVTRRIRDAPADRDADTFV